MTRVHVYRFHNEVALSVTGTEGETVYLSADNAALLAKHLAALSRSISGGKEASGVDVAARKHGEPLR